MEVLLGVCWFVVDIYDDFIIYVFIRMSKNGNSFKLCSIVNFILGCRFCSRSCYSLIPPSWVFPEYEAIIQHDLVKSSFMSLPYFLLLFHIGFLLNMCSSNATNNLTSKKQVCSLCYRHAKTRRRKGRKRCDLFYGGERDKPP